MLHHFDTAMVLYLNGLLREHYWLAKATNGLALNPIARGLPVFVPLMVVWFSWDHVKERGRMLLGLAGATVATFASVLLQKHLNFDVRPFFNPALHLYMVSPVDITQWDRIDSFPSDTSTLFSALCTIIFLEWRAAGIVAFLWSFLADGICRVALGFHYPSDIAGGFVLGIVAVLAFTSWSGLSMRVQRELERRDSRAAWIHALILLFLADAYELFPGLQGVMRFFSFLGKRL